MTAYLDAEPRSLEEVRRELKERLRKLTEWIDCSYSYPSERTWAEYDDLRARLRAAEAEIAARRT